jgi:hypothetical protein
VRYARDGTPGSGQHEVATALAGRGLAPLAYPPMPFKTLSSPRRITDLAAEVRACSALTQANLVAMLATDPVRVAIQPLGGQTGKIINLSLGTAEQIALLSKDAAVVRSGDDAVWAVVDLAHRPKLDQVARDVRVLCARPTGESALALGWDGTATAFTMSRNEVNARQFPLRGSVRACDVGATDTFVVVDVPGGGELRVHPGSTPEPGAAARASLPQEAAKLDRVRGGKKLSVVYRSGQPRLCVVTQDGGKLAAKMMTIDAPPICADVADTSLFVAFADGRVALYNSDAIAQAGESPATATSTLSLGSRGEPRAIALTAKASPSMWLGTSTGEVLEVSVVRKSAA